MLYSTNSSTEHMRSLGLLLVTEAPVMTPNGADFSFLFMRIGFGV